MEITDISKCSFKKKTIGIMQGVRAKINIFSGDSGKLLVAPTTKIKPNIEKKIKFNFKFFIEDSW